MTKKERAQSPNQAAPQGDTTAPESSAPGPDRALFHPLTWRCDKPAQPRSEYGRTTPEALAWLWEAAR